MFYDKTGKRDFCNQKNETEAIFNNLALISYFKYDKTKELLFLRSKIDEKSIKFKRNYFIKDEYFKNHNVEKNIQFELHHIIPFYYAKNFDELKIIDDWRNLIYIDANSHKLFTKNINFIRLNFDKDDAILDNFLGDKIMLENLKNIKYKISLQKQMIEYNKGLL